MPKYGGNNQILFGIRFNTDKSSLLGVKKSLQELQNIKIADFKGSADELEQIKKKAAQVESALTKAFNVKLNSLNLDQFYKELGVVDRNLDSIYADFSKIGSQGRAAFNSLAASLTTTNTQLRESAGLLQNMGLTMMNTVKWGIASSVMNTFTNSVQQAFQYVKSLDSALTDIRIVTGDSRDQMAQFAEQANRAAQSLGRSTMEYSKAALTYYQQGLSEEDVQVRTEATLKAQNITGAGSLMADYLTAVWNGYKVANEEAELYVDKLAAVADSSASNMSLLAVAMSKVASTANAMGVPVDSLNAQIATIVATTRQAPESVGNALKTIYARINDISTGAEDALVSLGNYSSKMALVGVNVLDANGNLRDTGDVIELVGEKWANLSREQQIYLARTMAGQRQYNNLIALFDNWGKYTDLVTVSMDSQGATMEKNSRYMESLEAHMNQLGAASERVKSAMIDSDSFKGLVDIGTNLTTLLANFIEAIGGGGNALLMLGSIATQVFSGIIAKEIGNTIIQAKNNKQIILLTRQVMLETQRQKTSDAYLDEQNVAYKNYIDNLQTLHSTWSVLSQDLRQAQEDRIKKLLSLENEQAKLRLNIKTVLEYRNAFKDDNFGRVMENKLQLSLNNVKDLLLEGKHHADEFIDSFSLDNGQSLSLNSIKEHIIDIQTQLKQGDVHQSNSIIQDLELISTKGSEATVDINDLADRIKQFYTLTGQDIALIPKLDELKNKIQSTQESHEKLDAVIKRVNQDAATVFNAQQVTKFISVLGQTLSVLNSISRVGKIIKNDSLSTGEKILQISQVLVSSIAVINNIVKTTKGILESTVIRLATEKGITREKEKQALIDEATLKREAQKNFLQSKGGQYNKLSFLDKNQYHELKEAADNAQKAVDNIDTSKVKNDLDILKLGIKDVGGHITTFLSQPLKLFGVTFGASVGSVIAGAAVAGLAIYGIVKYYNQAADAAKKARENALQAQKIYKDTRLTVNNLNSSLLSLNSAKNELKDLTKGTEEWQTALGKVNLQVLQLVETFPLLKQYLTSNDGLLGFKEGALLLIQELYARRATAQGMAYASADYTATQAENRSLIVDASREYDGIGGQITELSLTEVVNAVNQFGDDILKNSEMLQANTSLGKVQADAMILHRAKIIELAHSVDGNIKASLALRSAITNSYITQSSQYQGLDNPDAQAAFTKLVENGFNNASLDMEKYGQVNHQSGRTELDTNALVLRYNDLEGTNYKVNRWTGNIIDLLGKKVSKDIIKSAVAYADALENADLYYNDALNIIKQLGDNGARIYSNFSKDTADLANLSEKDFLKIVSTPVLLNKIALAMLLDPEADSEELNEKLSKYKERTIQLSNEYITSLPLGVQDAFERIDKTKISLTAQKQIGLILNGAFVLGKGLKDYQDQIALFFGDAIDAGKILDALNIDLSNINSLDDFKEEILKVTGVAPPAGEALEILYNTLKGIQEEAMTPDQIYNTIHDVIDKKSGKTLLYGDTITEEQAEALKQAGIDVEQYFQRMIGGNYQLKKSAELFYSYANGISLLPFKQSIKEAQEQINNNNFLNYNYEDLNKSTFENTGYGPLSKATNINYNLVQDQVNALAGIGAIDDNQLSDYNNLIETRRMDLLVLQQIGQQIRDNQDKLLNYQESAKQYAELNLHEQQLQYAYSQQDLGLLFSARNEGLFDTLSVEEYKDAILSVSDALGLEILNVLSLSSLFSLYGLNLDWVSDKLQGQVGDSALVAASLEDMISGVLNIQKTWKETVKELLAGGEASTLVIGATAEILSDMFNQPIDVSFVLLNLGSIRALALGDITAIQDLSSALFEFQMQAALQEKAELGIEINADQFNEDLTWLLDEINTINPLLEVGAHIEDQEYYTELEKMLNQMYDTKDQMEDALMGLNYTPDVLPYTVPIDNTEYNSDTKTYTFTYTDPITGEQYTKTVDEDLGSQYNQAGQITLFSIKGSKFSSGPKGISNAGGSRVIPKAPTSSGNKGNKGSTKKPTTVKAVTPTAKKLHVEDRSDPYHDINKALLKQEDLLDKILKKDKKLVNKDRLKNIEDQNKAIQDQNKLLSTKADIAQGEKIRLRNELVADLGNAIQFNPDGSIANYNQALDAATANYNKAIDKRNNTVAKADNDLNAYIAKYNKMSAALQLKNKAQYEKIKEEHDAIIKKADEELKLEEEKRKRIQDNVKEYENTLDIIDDINKQTQLNLEKIYENNILAFNLKVHLSIDSGLLERDWLDFEKKFIKKLDDGDFIGSAKASMKDLMSYFNSNQIQATADAIKRIQNEIAIMQAGGTSSIYDDNMAQAQLYLEEYMKQQMSDLEDIQGYVDDIKENYLDALDDAKDKMDDQIEQYERVNDLIDHNVKLVLMIYGDKAYDTMLKYYLMQKENNNNALDSLRQQQQYWQNLLNNEEVGTLSYNRIKENLDEVTNDLNAKLEDMIDKLADQFENRLNSIVANLNLSLTDGRGLDYLDDQWDYINNYDDKFLDTFESKMGIQEVQDLYQLAVDGLNGSPANQQKINKLMNLQLKMLREKDSLTQYDIDRAKASLEVEKARMALEDARYNKTKMRLRRDSQGNYTYQYVADEEKLSDLQSALDDAQANLYNMDKDHYKENLDTLYNTYKEYLEKRQALEEEYRQAQAAGDEQEMARIQLRIDLAAEQFGKIYDSLSEDNKYALEYLSNSFADGMGLDKAAYSADEFTTIMKENIPQVSSNIQDLVDKITGLGGLIKATDEAMNKLRETTTSYVNDVKSTLEAGGTSVDTIMNVVDEEGNPLDLNIQAAKDLITTNEELIASCEAQVQEMQKMLSWLDAYMNKVMDVLKLVANLRNAYNLDQNLYGSNLQADVIPVTDNNLDTTNGMNFTGNPATDAAAVKKQIDALLAQYEKFLQEMSIATFDTGGATGSWGDASGRLAFLHKKELVLNQEDTANILAVVESVRSITSALNGVTNGEIASLVANATGLMGSLNTASQLDQNVHIEANFPNVTQHTEIEQAFENLVNMASMHASKYRD